MDFRGYLFLTHQKDNAIYKSIEEFGLKDKTSDAVLKDEIILIEKKR